MAEYDSSHAEKFVITAFDNRVPDRVQECRAQNREVDGQFQKPVSGNMIRSGVIRPSAGRAEAQDALRCWLIIMTLYRTELMRLTISVNRACKTGLAALMLSVFLGAPAALAWFWEAPSWSQINADLASDYPGVPLISVTRLHETLNDPSAQKPLLIDTRSAEEFAVSHLPGAVHAEDVNAVKALLGSDTGARPIVVYCSVGVRSARVAEDLLTAGIEPVSNLQGSIFEWANRGLPMVRGREPVNSVHPFNQKWGALLDRRHWSHEP